MYKLTLNNDTVVEFEDILIDANGVARCWNEGPESDFREMAAAYAPGMWKKLEKVDA